MLRTRKARMAAIVGLCGALATIGAGMAIADDSQSPTTKPVVVTFAATVQKTDVTTCKGTDGTYHQDHTISTGTSSSADDPRLTGKITVDSRSLINTTTGYGTSTGSIVLRDPNTNEVLSRATFSAVNTYDGVLHGFEIAE